MAKTTTTTTIGGIEKNNTTEIEHIHNDDEVLNRGVENEKKIEHEDDEGSYRRRQEHPTTALTCTHKPIISMGIESIMRAHTHTIKIDHIPIALQPNGKSLAQHATSEREVP